MQDSLPNAQYARKICARLYFFPQCTIYVQDLCKSILLSPMCNICTRLQVLEEICHISHMSHILLSPMGNICARLYFSPECARPSHHLCTKHHHSAGHKISIFLFRLTGQTTYNWEKKNQIRCDFFLIIKTLFEMLK